MAATGVKHQLSKAPEVKGQMNRLHQDQRLPFNYHVTRDAFNQLIAPLLQRPLRFAMPPFGRQTERNAIG